MRWLLGSLVILILLLAIYLGSALWSLAALANAVRTGNGAAVIERTDVTSLKQSIADQVVAAYLARIGETRQVGSTERMLIRAAGGGVAEAMIARLLTPERLTEILKTGQIQGVQELPPISGLPQLIDLDTGNALAMLQRLRFIQPIEFGFRLTDATADRFSEARMHFAGTGWKLSGLTLPAGAINQLAASLPAK